MEFDRDNPLNRIANESRKANDALRDYYALGMERSLSKLHKKHTEGGIKRAFSTIGHWSAKFLWQARVDRQKQIDDAIGDARRISLIGEQVEKEIEAAIKMYEKGLALLTLPIVERRVTDQEGVGYIVMPANAVELGAGRQLLREASQMARLALNMPTELKKISGSGSTGEIIMRVIYGDGDDNTPPEATP